MKHTLPLLLLIAIAGEDLHLTWTPHPDNYQVRVAYQCEKDAQHPAFLAVNVWDIEPAEGRRIVRRIVTPDGQRCLIVAYVMRIPPDWDGDEKNLVVSEWQLVMHTERD